MVSRTLARAGVANPSEKIREERLIWFGYVERKIGKDVVMRTWKMEMGGHRKIRIPKQRGSDAPTPKRENVKEEASYTFADPTWMCVFVIVVGCTFLGRVPPNPIRLCETT